MSLVEECASPEKCELVEEWTDLLVSTLYISLSLYMNNSLCTLLSLGQSVGSRLVGGGGLRIGSILTEPIDLSGRPTIGQLDRCALANSTQSSGWLKESICLRQVNVLFRQVDSKNQPKAVEKFAKGLDYGTPPTLLREIETSYCVKLVPYSLPPSLTRVGFGRLIPSVDISPSP